MTEAIDEANACIKLESRVVKHGDWQSSSIRSLTDLHNFADLALSTFLDLVAIRPMIFSLEELVLYIQIRLDNVA